MKSMKCKPNSIKELQNYIESLYGDVNEAHSIDYIYAYLFPSSGDTILNCLALPSAQAFSSSSHVPIYGPHFQVLGTQ